MFRKKLESESGTKIADPRFLMICEKPADSGSRIRIAIPDTNTSHSGFIIKFFECYFFQEKVKTVPRQETTRVNTTFYFYYYT